MKRKRRSKDVPHADKRQKIDVATSRPLRPSCALLSQYYPQVLTLRQYLISRLPKTAKQRRRRVHQYGTCNSSTSSDQEVADLLDRTLIGSFSSVKAKDYDAIDKDLSVFTQQLSDSTISISLTQGNPKQSEIVDFALWSLFRRHVGGHRPAHILCHGYQRTAAGPELYPLANVPGIFSNGYNQHMESLRQHPWTALPSLVGSGADRIIGDMLLECGIFVPIADSSNFNQLSGRPLCDLKPLRKQSDDAEVKTDKVNNENPPVSNLDSARKPPTWGDIRFVRQRMLYARSSTSGSGKIHAGLGHIHILNRLRDVENETETLSLAKYVFPREFGLHNVFSSEVSPKDTAQLFKDYTLRDKEIAKANFIWKQNHTSDEQPLPKRLKGEVHKSIRRIRKRHARCPYHALLQHYCPPPRNNENMELSTRHASSAAEVSAFCRAAVKRVFPDIFWGTGETGMHNKKVLMRIIDSFVRLRRYESMSLHDVMQTMKLQGVEWLMPNKIDPSLKISRTDFVKRQQLLAELLYYIFDSFLIPLIRNNFHVTESNVHRNQLFYFRHDVWRVLSEPALTTLKDNMLEECDTNNIKKMLARRALGVSRVRMLPKEKGMRPIINLRRRVHKLQYGQMVLGKSINSILTPAFSVLNYEKNVRPDHLGSALFSVDEIFPRLQTFRASLHQQGLGNAPLYFAKVDVQACFDTIPQKRLMTLIKTIIDSEQYQIARYSRAKLLGGHNETTPGFGAKPSWKFLTKATAGEDAFDFGKEIKADTSEGRTRTIYVDGVNQRVEQRRAVLNLLEEHVEANIIKVGRRYYRQKKGIPQGSIVSSLLCGYIYGELEREVLSFLNDGPSVLLRLIDDFLVITTDRKVAERFMRTMHNGIPQYGVEVKAEKSRANFDVLVDKDTPIPRLPAASEFPYCGHAINTQTLDLSKDRIRRQQANLANSVTVEHSKLPGQSFYRKTLSALKLQMNAMLLSTSYNSMSTVLTNLYHSFSEVALKSYFYIKSLSPHKQPQDKLFIRAIDDLIKLAVVLMQRRKRSSKDVMPYECAVSASQTRWLACTAFTVVLRKRQTRFSGVLDWLAAELNRPAVRMQRGQLEEAVKRC